MLLIKGMPALRVSNKNRATGTHRVGILSNTRRRSHAKTVVNSLNNKKSSSPTSTNDVSYARVLPLPTKTPNTSSENAANTLTTASTTPFTYAFMHSFGCGVAGGGLNEVVESIRNFAALTAQYGLDALLTRLPDRTLFRLHWTEDHVIGICVFALIYIIEVLVLSVTLRDEQNKDAQAVAASSKPSMAGMTAAFVDTPVVVDQQQQQDTIVDASIITTEKNRNTAPTTTTATDTKKNRSRYLTHVWYAVALSSDVAMDKPLPIDLCDEKLVLFRGTDGDINCTSSICPHRGAPLSMGWTKEATTTTSSSCSGSGGSSSSSSSSKASCIVCPYHGWAFDGKGHLLEVPAEGSDATLPKRPLLTSYPVLERGGFVWVFYDPARTRDASLSATEIASMPATPIPMIAELLAAHSPGGRATPDSRQRWTAVHGSFEMKAPHMAVFENAIDVSHIHFLHGGTFGNEDVPSIRDMKLRTVGDTSVEARFELTNKSQPYFEVIQKLYKQMKNQKDVDGKQDGGEEISITAIAMLPCTSVIAFELRGGLRMITFVSTVPLTATTSVNRYALIRNFAHAPQLDDYVRRSMESILTEDKAVVEQLRADLMDQEVSVRSDLPQVAFRKLRNAHIARGYSTDANLHPNMRRYEQSEAAKLGGWLNALDGMEGEAI
ncbi:rieske domain-containing protein [Pycnococcus provasolii]